VAQGTVQGEGQPGSSSSSSSSRGSRDHSRPAVARVLAACLLTKEFLCCYFCFCLVRTYVAVGGAGPVHTSSKLADLTPAAAQLSQSRQQTAIEWRTTAKNVCFSPAVLYQLWCEIAVLRGVLAVQG
jgi:hypothetical protein